MIEWFYDVKKAKYQQYQLCAVSASVYVSSISLLNYRNWSVILLHGGSESLGPVGWEVKDVKKFCLKILTPASRSLM